MQKKTREERDSCRRLELRFIKSYKYKHKRVMKRRINLTSSLTTTTTTTSCDKIRKNFKKSTSSLVGRMKLNFKILFLIVASLLSTTRITTLTEAYCPSKCVCNDQLLSANCTQVPTISIVPMTLNPLLRHMILNYLPIVELSNSLSVYRQLETLDLKSNQLKQISYQNFNFKAAPPQHSSITIHQNNNNNNTNRTLSSFYNSDNAETSKKSTGGGGVLHGNEQHFARHLKNSIEKFATSLSSLSDASDASGQETNQAQAGDEIRFHLRYLDLSDNRIDQLGDFVSKDELINHNYNYNYNANEQQTSGATDNNNPVRKLKSIDLERQAPFLTLIKLELLNLSMNKLRHLNEHVFLGLINLKRLDLSRNQLEFIDKHSFVSLIELEVLNLSSNKLAKHLNHLSLSFCRAPMIELKHLDLSDNYNNNNNNNAAFSQADEIQNNYLDHDNRESLLLLPNQMFICTSKLKSLKLINLQLRYIQVSAFDNLLQLEYLNLSKNNLEQVPNESLSFYGSNISKTLKYLDLSETLIEFVNVKTFQTLEMLQILEMNNMPLLVSFDLATFNLKQTISNQINNSSLFINEQLIELHLKNNQRLQSIHSSLSSMNNNNNNHNQIKIKFLNLKQIKLDGNVELRELALEQMLDFTSTNINTNINNNNNPLRVDLSYSNKLNCTSCQMNWLIESALFERNSNHLFDLELTNNNNMMIDSNVKNWLPIPSRQTNENNLLMTMPSMRQLPSGSLSSPYKQQFYMSNQQDRWPTNQNYYNQPMPLTTTTITTNMNMNDNKRFSTSALVHLSDPALIGCSWPYSMSLGQLLDMNYNFNPIFNHCKSLSMNKQLNEEENVYLKQQQQQQNLAFSSTKNNHNLNHLIGLFEEKNKSLLINSDNYDTNFELDSSSIQSSFIILLGALIILAALFLITKNLIQSEARHKRQAVNELEFNFDGSPIQMMLSAQAPNSNHAGSGTSSGSSPGDCSTSSIISAGGQNNYHNKQKIIIEQGNNNIGNRAFYHLSATSNNNNNNNNNTNNNNNNNNKKKKNLKIVRPTSSSYLNSPIVQLGKEGFVVGSGESGNLFSRFVNQLSVSCRRSNSAESSSNSILTTTTADFIMASSQQQQQQPSNGNNHQHASSMDQAPSYGIYNGQNCHEQRRQLQQQPQQRERQHLPPLPASLKASQLVYAPSGCLSDNNNNQPIYETAQFDCSSNLAQVDHGGQDGRRFVALETEPIHRAGTLRLVQNKRPQDVDSSAYGGKSERELEQEIAGQRSVNYANFCRQQESVCPNNQYEPGKGIETTTTGALVSTAAEQQYWPRSKLGAISLASYETCQNNGPSIQNKYLAGGDSSRGMGKINEQGSSVSHLKQVTSGQLQLGKIKQAAILSPEEEVTRARENYYTGSPVAKRNEHEEEKEEEQEESKSAYLVDGHIYVTLDGPIKQNEGHWLTKNEYNNNSGSIYESMQPEEQFGVGGERPLIRATTAMEREDGGPSLGKVYEINSCFENRNRNKILVQDYKSFECEMDGQAAALTDSRQVIHNKQAHYEQTLKEAQNYGQQLKTKTFHLSSGPSAKSRRGQMEGAEKDKDKEREKNNKRRNKFKLANNNNNDNNKNSNGRPSSYQIVQNQRESKGGSGRAFMGAHLGAKLSSSSSSSSPSSSSSASSSSRPPGASGSSEQMDRNISSFQQAEPLPGRMLFLKNSTPNELKLEEDSESNFAFGETSRNVIDHSITINNNTNNLELSSTSSQQPTSNVNGRHTIDPVHSSAGNSNNNDNNNDNDDNTSKRILMLAANSEHSKNSDLDFDLNARALLQQQQQQQQQRRPPCREAETSCLLQNRNKYDDANDADAQKPKTTDDNDYVINGLRLNSATYLAAAAATPNNNNSSNNVSNNNNNNIRLVLDAMRNHGTADGPHSELGVQTNEWKLNGGGPSLLANACGDFSFLRAQASQGAGAIMGVTEGVITGEAAAADVATTSCWPGGSEEQRHYCEAEYVARSGERSRLGAGEQEVGRREKNISSNNHDDGTRGIKLFSPASVDMIGKQNFTTTMSLNNSYALKAQSHHQTSSNRDYVGNNHRFDGRDQSRQVKQQQGRQNCDLTATTTRDFTLNHGEEGFKQATINNRIGLEEGEINNLQYKGLQTTNTVLDSFQRAPSYSMMASQTGNTTKASPNEIYSNQFYYCKPQSTATLSLNKNNNKL